MIRLNAEAPRWNPPQEVRRSRIPQGKPGYIYFDRIYRIDMIFFLAFQKKARKHHPLSAE